MNMVGSSQFLLYGFFVCLLHILHTHPRGNSSCDAVLHALVDVGVFCRDFGAALAQCLLDDAQVFGLLIEVRAAAVAEEVAGVAGLFESRGGERAVDDVADADARDTPLCVVGGARDDGRREPIFLRHCAALLEVCLEEL